MPIQSISVITMLYIFTEKKKNKQFAETYNKDFQIEIIFLYTEKSDVIRAKLLVLHWIY